LLCYCFYNTSTTTIYTLSLHDALPIYQMIKKDEQDRLEQIELEEARKALAEQRRLEAEAEAEAAAELKRLKDERLAAEAANAPVDRKSTRLNSSHVSISYAVFCLKKKK